MSNTDVTVLPNGQAGAIAPVMTTERLELLKRTLAKSANLTDDELNLFGTIANKLQLDPFAKQIYAAKLDGVLVPMTSIDGFRLIAKRTGKFRGRVGPFWCGADGKWLEVWLSDQPPVAARVGVRHAEYDDVMWAFCKYTAFVRTNANGQPNNFWRRMPEHMLAKCAEAQALRAAFPNELSGVYVEEELDQRFSDPPTPQPRVVEHRAALTPLPEPAPAKLPKDEQLRLYWKPFARWLAENGRDQAWGKRALGDGWKGKPEDAIKRCEEVLAAETDADTAPPDGDPWTVFTETGDPDPAPASSEAIFDSIPSASAPEPTTEQAERGNLLDTWLALKDRGNACKPTVQPGGTGDPDFQNAGLVFLRKAVAGFADAVKAGEARTARDAEKARAAK